MPQIASAKKRVKVSARQAAKNQLHRSRSRTAVKQVRDLAAAGKAEDAAKHVATAQKYLDKAAKVGAWHPNTVARYKSRLAAALKKAGAKPAPKAAKAPAKTTKKAPAKSPGKKSEATDSK